MGIRRFPAPSKKAQQKDRNPCCQDPTNHKSWDCGCSWGCDLCWVGYRCQVCDACLTHKYHEVQGGAPEEGTWPGKRARKGAYDYGYQEDTEP